VQNNHITHCGAITFCRLLEGLTLRSAHIDMSHNPLGLAGATAMCMWAKTHPFAYVCLRQTSNVSDGMHPMSIVI
jgi:hypothetical protein